MTTLAKATDELTGWYAMLAERFPEMKPELDARLQEVFAEVAAGFQHIIDYGEGRITEEQFLAIVAEREAAETAARRAHYGPGPVHYVTCESCSAQHRWDEEELGEPPPVYFECEDITGVDCSPDDDEEDDDPDE